MFGKPWWFEKAGWSSDRWIERRDAILERMRASWPDWPSFEHDAATEDDVKACIRSLVAAFDDASWCLPHTPDPLKRLEQKLNIYYVWAKSILREATRLQKVRSLADQDTASESSRFIHADPTTSDHELTRRGTEHTGQGAAILS